MPANFQSQLDSSGSDAGSVCSDSFLEFLSKNRYGDDEAPKTGREKR